MYRLRIWLGSLLWLALTCLLALPVFSLNMSFERVSTAVKSPLPLGPLDQIAEDPQGFIWLAGKENLVRYDGIEYRHYGESPGDPKGLCARFNNDMRVDKQGILWVSTDRALCRYDPKKDYFSIFAVPEPPVELRAHTNFFAIGEDLSGNLYVGRRGSLLVIDVSRQKIQHLVLPDQLNARAAITDIQAIATGADGQVWLGTRDIGLMSYEPEFGKFERFHKPAESGDTQSANVQSVVEDNQGDVWLGYYQNGIERINPASGQRDFFRQDPSNPASLGSNRIWEIIKDRSGGIWVTSDGGGLSYYNRTTGQFEFQHYEESSVFSLSSDKTRAIYEDRNGNLWVTTYPGGLHFYQQRSQSVLNFHRTTRSRKRQLNDNGVLSFYEENDGTVLVGTEKGLNRYVPATREFVDLSDPSLPLSLPPKPVIAINKDAQGYYWFGIWGHGVYRVHFGRNEKVHFVAGSGEGDLNTNIVWKFIPDAERGLWLATQDGGINYFNFASQKFEKIPERKASVMMPSASHVYDIARDLEGFFWVAVMGGGGLYRYFPDKAYVSLAVNGDGGPANLTSSSVRDVLVDKAGRLWLATEDQGIFMREPGSPSFFSIGAKDGLTSMMVTALLEHPDGSIWAGTLAGAAQVDPISRKVRMFNQSQGILSTSVNRGALLLSTKGEIYVGSTEGFSVFTPEKVAAASGEFPVRVTRLKLANREVTPSENSGPLPVAIDKTDAIELRHSDSMFGFEFAALSFHLPAWNQYAYQLEGYDKQWNTIGNYNQAIYTNIPPGTYNFRVKAANSDGVWSETPANIRITIAPPPWLSGWAYALYAMVLVLISLAIYKTVKQQLNLEKEKRLNVELLKLNDMKDAFLANTSHELRTPISGMVGLAEALAREVSPYQYAQRDKIQLIIASGKRLGSLINDILDYAKMTDQDIELYKSLIDIKQLVRQVLTIAAPLAKNKDLQLINDVAVQASYLFADANRMEQIVLNLVSNAIKYSDKGVVKISTRLEKDVFILAVQDSGIGIAEADLQRLFKPYSQLEASANRRAGGTGLGLTVTRHLIERHEGTVTVTSTLGVGSEFVIRIPYAETQKHLATGVLLASNAAQSHAQDASSPRSDDVNPQPLEFLEAANDDLIPADEPARPATEQESKPRPRVLLVDDDAINMMILTELLELGGYEVLQAHDGLAAYTILQQRQDFDVLVSDLLMPKMGGFELAEKVRTELLLQQMPILFLSANITEHDEAEAARWAPALVQLKPLSKPLLFATLAELLVSPAQILKS
jgi:two-component system, sensor histidine kinase ChiS